ncbi:MAG: hypothetical protein J5I90_07230, partial [Caldilineales bacterium]|nr:hypothetical protein [Caldilineales bacterium]
FYNFVNNLPGDDVVVQDPIPGLDSTTGRIRALTLIVIGATGSSNDNDFGNITFGRIGDFIFLDTNGNGVQDPSENTGVPGIPITLTNLSTFAISTTVSAADGSYLFDGLLPGSYSVQSIFSHGGIVRTTTTPLNVNLGIGEDYLDADIGYIAPTAVTLVNFMADRQSTGVMVSWITGAESDLTGFRVLRAASADGPFKAVSPIITATNKPTGSSYQWLDASAPTNATMWYQLETLPDGEVFGPIPVKDDPGAGRSNPIYIPLIIR